MSYQASYAHCMCTRGLIKGNVRVWRRTPRYWRRLASRRHAVREHSVVHVRAGATDADSLTFFPFLSLVSSSFLFLLFIARANVHSSPFFSHQIESKVKWFNAGIFRETGRQQNSAKRETPASSVCLLRRFHKISAGDLLSARGENNNTSETLRWSGEGTSVFSTENIYPES